MKKTHLKITAAVAMLTLTVSIPFPSMAAQRFCMPVGNVGNITAMTNSLCLNNGSSQIVLSPCGNSCFGNIGNNNSNSSSLNNSASAYISQVLSHVNAERAKAGLSPLTLDTGASQAADIRAKEIVNNFSHTRPNGSSFSSVLTENGVSYRSAGENIAYGQNTPSEVMNGWMNSSGHRANILNQNFTQIGIGHYEDANGTDYWVQIFLRE